MEDLAVPLMVIGAGLWLYSYPVVARLRGYRRVRTGRSHHWEAPKERMIRRPDDVWEASPEESAAVDKWEERFRIVGIGLVVLGGLASGAEPDRDEHF